MSADLEEMMMKRNRKMIIAAIALVLCGLLAEGAVAGRTSWDVEYPMCNQKIEWTGAGYMHH